MADEITAAVIRNMLHPLHHRGRRQIVFCGGAERAAVAGACRELRSEGYEIVEKVKPWIVTGDAYVVDADLLQPTSYEITPEGMRVRVRLTEEGT